MQVWIARDPSATAVSLRPVEISSGPHRREWGNIIDLTPGPPMTAKAAERRTKFQLFLVFVGVSYFCSVGQGAYWWLILLLAAALAMAIFSAEAKAKEPGKVATSNLRRYPADVHRLLTSGQERGEFDRLLRLAERVDKTLPSLKQLVDRNEADGLLAQAIWDGAKSLARKQEIRVVRDDLKRHSRERPGDMSRSRLDLLEQQQRASALWSEVNDELDKLRSHLTVAAEAGEVFIRDRDLDDTLERTGKALAKLSIDEPSISSAASEQLAAETTAVVQAYRELHDLYGGKR